MREIQPCVYIMASRWHGTLYIGVTSNLIKRVWEHQNDVPDGFTRKYRVHTLVWFEQHAKMQSAIDREKELKEWRRPWKVDLSEKVNPQWRDLYPELF